MVSGKAVAAMMKGFRVDRNDGRIYAMGVTAVSGGMHFPFPSKGKTCAVILYKRGAKSPKDRIEFPVNARIGNMWSMTVLGGFPGLEYVYEVDEQQMPDPYGKRFTGMKCWESPTRRDKPVRTPVGTGGGAYDWEDDILLYIPCDQHVIYYIHTRGFTKHASSGPEGDSRGTFKSMAERIPCLKGLGIVTVEMIPPVEFEELIISECVDGSPFAAEEPDGKLNYWEYTRGYYLAPKCTYNSGSVRGPEREFKDMVEALHRAGLELVLELFFGGKGAPSYVLDVVRLWAQEYHVDGVRLVGYAPVKLLDEDPYFNRLRLLAPGWDDAEPGQEKHLTECNDGFMMDIRSFLKEDEDQFNRPVYHARHNPGQVDVVNYMTDTNGLTLMNTVPYDTRRNEANGEKNRGGTDCNQSWNCRVEGPSGKRRIIRVRREQIRDAPLMLPLSQGAPLLTMGDESGRTKRGSNNPYCQDNDISWLSWGLLNSNSSIHEFVKHVIQFGKEHSVFHMEKRPALMDYRSMGLPDMFYHGLKIQCPTFDRFLRQLGILYYGKYGEKPDGRKNNYFYIAFNMHWEPHESTLPNLPKNYEWHTAFSTGEDRVNGMYPGGNESVLGNQKSIMIMVRTIVVLMGKEAPAQRKASRGEAAGKSRRKEEEADDTVRGNNTIYRESQTGGLQPSSGAGQDTGALQL